MSETCKQFVERIWGKCTKKQMEGLLWHCTAFPCIDVEELEKQLKEVKEKSGGNYDVAMEQAEQSIQRAMEGIKKQ